MDDTTIVNIVLVGILAIGAITGAIKGFTRQIIELIGLVVSFFVGAVLASWLAALLSDHTSIPRAPAMVIGFLAVFVGGMVAFHFVAIAAQRLVHTTFFGWFDRLCGALTGLLFSLFVASILVSVALEMQFSHRLRDSVEGSSVGMFVQPIAGWVFNSVFPRDSGNLAGDAMVRASAPRA